MPVEAFPPVADLELRPELRDFDERLHESPAARARAAVAYETLAASCENPGPMAEYERRPHVPTGSNKPESPEGGKPRSRMSMPRPRFIVIVLVLLALNYASVALLGPGREPSIDIPYNPTFRAQVEAGNVERISSQGETVEGEFKKAVKPPDDSKGKAAKNFETEVPTFAEHRRALEPARRSTTSSSRPSRSTPAACWSTCCSASAR